MISSTTGRTEDVLFIEKGSTAPFSGILFTESKAKEIRSDLLESDKLKLQLESQRLTNKNFIELSQLKDAEIELYKKQNQRLLRSEQTSNTMNYIWFGLGILATGVAVYGAGGLAR